MASSRPLAAAIGRLALVMALAAVLFLAAAPPSSSRTEAYDVALVQGRLWVGGLAIDMPAAGVPSCPGIVAMTGTVALDDPAPIDTMAGDLMIVTDEIVVPGVPPFVVMGTGASGPGAAAGDHDRVTDRFGGLVIPSFAFSLREVDPVTCALGATLCGGTASLTLAGVLGTWMVTTAGEITAMDAACPVPHSQVVGVGTPMGLTATPASPGDPGALVERL